MLLSRLLLQFLLFAAASGAQNLTLADIPECAVQCLLKCLPNAGCEAADLKCQCESSVLFNAMSYCIQEECSKHDAVTFTKFDAQMCNLPYESRQSELYGFVWGSFAVIWASTVLRFVSRWTIHRAVFWDDYMLIAGLLVSLGLSACANLMIGHGLGIHVYQLTYSGIAPSLYYFFISEILYVVVKMFVKFALVIFFLRIFPGSKFRIGCYLMIVYVFVLSLIWGLLLLFQCRPISANWDARVVNPQCSNVQIYAYGGAGVSISQDLLILVFPIPVLAKLNIGMRKRLELIAIFSVGTFVIVTSVIRLHSIKHFGGSPDPTWDNIDITIWTCVELGVGILSCNIPSISSLIKFQRRKMGLGSERSRTTATHPTETCPRTFPPASSNSSARALAAVRTNEESVESNIELKNKEERFAEAGGVWCKTEVLVESEPCEYGRAV